MAKTEFRIWYNTKDNKKHKKSKIYVGWSIEVKRLKITPWYINLMDEHSWRCITRAPDETVKQIFDIMVEANEGLEEGRKFLAGDFKYNFKGNGDVQWTVIFDPATPPVLYFVHWEKDIQKKIKTQSNELNNCPNLICICYDNSDVLGLGDGPWL